MPAGFPTVQEAIAAAAAGDTIVVAPGTYAGTVDFLGKDVSIRSSDGPETTTIDGGGLTGVRIGPGGTLEGFTIQNARASFGAGLAVRGIGSRIAGNVFVANQQGGGGFGAGIGGNGASPIIDGNIFRSNTCDSQHLSGVVSFVNSSSPLIINNLFEGNFCRAINLTLPAGNNPRILNNTIVDNPVGIRLNAFGQDELHVFRNNVIVENGIGLDFDSGGATPTWDHNLVHGNGTDYQGIADQTGLAGNLSVDPLFEGTGSFTLTPQSPAIDAGSAEDAPSTDLDGAPRPIDGDGDGTAEHDIGAYEAPRADSTPPDPFAALIRLRGGHPQGRFEIGYSCVDLLDPAPVATAELNGIPVTDGQEVVLRVAEHVRVTTKNGLRIWAPSFELLVMCVDQAGNTSHASASAFGPEPVITPGAASVLEGTGSNTVVQIPVTLSAPANLPVSVEWATVAVPANSAIAQPGSDFVAAAGTLTFAPGETAASVGIEVVGDALAEPPLLWGEWGLVRFLDPTNASLDLSFFGFGVVVIVDDD